MHGDGVVTKTNGPLISIGIPTYNRAAGNLREALSSAVTQTYPNIEIVVSDNASSDNTGELVQSFKDQRIRYYRQSENIGAHNNFNFCLEKARGDYFLLLHDDDLIDPDFVRLCVDALPDNGQVGVVLTGVRVIGPGGEVISEHPNRVGGLPQREFLMGWFTGNIALYLCNTLYNTVALKTMGGFNSPIGLFQDGVATIRLSSQLGRVDVSDPKASFRRHLDNRGSAAGVAAWLTDCRYLSDLILKLVPDPDGRLAAAASIFFTRKCYRVAAAVGNPWHKVVFFFKIWSAFGYHFSPFKWFYKVRVMPYLRRVVMYFARKIKGS
jgi:glycosyltransferase involved in cell wall biosynthesis